MENTEEDYRVTVSLCAMITDFYGNVNMEMEMDRLSNICPVQNANWKLFSSLKQDQDRDIDIRVRKLTQPGD